MIRFLHFIEFAQPMSQPSWCIVPVKGSPLSWLDPPVTSQASKKESWLVPPVAPRPEKRTWTDESKPGPPTKLPQNGQLHFQVMTGDPQVRILNVKLHMWCFLLAQRCLLAENRRWIWQMHWRKNVNLEKNYWLRVALGKAQVAALRVKNLIWSSGSRISELSCVCVWHICMCKTSLIYIIYMRGVTGVPGGSVTNEDTSPGPV